MLKLIILILVFANTIYAELPSARIVGISVYDQGINGTNEPAIDVSQGLCGEEPELTPEPFNETIVGLTITNQSLFDIRFQKVRFRLRDNLFNPNNRGRLAPIGGGEVSSKETKELKAFLLDIDGGSKYFYGSNEAVPASGFANLQAIISGRNFKGKRIKLKANSAITFHNLNRCQ
jgi:hypothetical protein